MSDKETRLLRIVQKLEAKIKTVWDENNELKQKLELATLDKEISDENCANLSVSIKQLETKVSEYEELNELNNELEKSYLAEKQFLDAEVVRLNGQINAQHLKNQEIEALKIEVQTTERKLQAANFDLNILKTGIYHTLKPLIPNSEWLWVIEHLHIDVTNHLNSYKSGDISIKKLAILLNEAVSNYAKSPTTDEVILLAKSGVDIPANIKLIIESNPLHSELVNRISRNIETESLLNPEQPNSKLRIEILESKLAEAQSVAQELENLQQWQVSAKQLHAKLESEIENLRKEVAKRDSEVARLIKESIPLQAYKLNEAREFGELQKTIAFLTKKRGNLQLEPLQVPKPTPISLLTGNARVQKLRKMSFELSEPFKATISAVDQEVQLHFL